MPSLLTWESTGLITNRVRNSAMPASTWFGGTVVSPSALRVRDSTTRILVKLVHMSSSAGATPSAVSARIATIEVLGLAPRSRLIWVDPAGGSGCLGTAGAV